MNSNKSAFINIIKKLATSHSNPEWRYGQSVFNYVEHVFGSNVAREVPFRYGVDCFYDDSRVDEFLSAVFDLTHINEIHNEDISKTNVASNDFTYEQALKTLVQYNAWRRDDHVPNHYKMPNPTEIGKAVDLAIVTLSNIVGCNILPEEDNIEE